MASRAMHLAIAHRMIGEGLIKDTERYRIGQILPDAFTTGAELHGDSHFIITVCHGTRKMIDFVHFKKQFQNELMRDDLYLGYYLHLIQDAVHRKFLLHDHGYKVTSTQTVKDLYRDYRLLNSYLVSKYHIQPDFQVPDKFTQEKIFAFCEFALDKYLENIKGDFLPCNGGKTSVFTEQMADEYIESCTSLCRKEIENLKAGYSCLAPMDYIWQDNLEISS